MDSPYTKVINPVRNYFSVKIKFLYFWTPASLNYETRLKISIVLHSIQLISYRAIYFIIKNEICMH